MRLLIGRSQKPFSVHQVRLCNTSSYFKNKLEPGRKRIEGDCGICLEVLMSHGKILTWCTKCGNNVHQECLEKWAKQKMTCPMCRAPWVPRDIFETMSFRDFEQTGFDVYVQWLYTDSIPEYGEDSVERCKRLLQAHSLGDAISDPAFINTVRCEMVRERRAADVGRAALEYVCRRSSTTSRSLQKFLVHLYAMQLPCNLEWLNIAPRTILIDIAECFVTNIKEFKSGEDIWTRLTQAGFLKKQNKEEE